MAAICSHHLGEIDGLAFDVAVTGFEEFAGDADQASYELAYAAQSWHWIAPEQRVAGAARLLVAGGTVALVWNVARPHPPGWKEPIDAAYAAVGIGETVAAEAGGTAPARQPLAAVLSADARWRARRELEESGLFGPVTVASRPWAARYDTASWLELLETHSDHRLLAPAVREELLGRIGAVIDARGGEIEVRYDAVALCARRR